MPKIRLTAEVFGIEYPATLLENVSDNVGDGWRRRVNFGAAFFADHQFEQRTAFHYGVGINVMHSTLSRQAYTEDVELWTIEPLARVGYRFFPFSTNELFLNPYAAIGLPISSTTPEAIGGDTFVESPYQLLATLLVG